MAATSINAAVTLANTCAQSDTVWIAAGRNFEVRGGPGIPVTVLSDSTRRLTGLTSLPGDNPLTPYKG